MDYEQIEQIMSDHQFSNDPAFDGGNALAIAIEPIPSMNGCPLGLYDPDTAMIILPPDASIATLYHELGHRHGHYHYDDLSERYAEDFRKIFQKGKALLYQGRDFAMLPTIGNLFEEGDKGAVEVALYQPLAQNELLEIKRSLYSYPESPHGVYYGNSNTPWLRVEFTKGIDWLVIVGATLAGIAALTAGILGYAVYKVAKEAPWTAPVAILGVIATGLLLVGLGAKYAPQIKRQLELAR